MNQRQLSSALTPFNKFLFPALWIGGFATATVVLFAQVNDPEALKLRWIFLDATILGAAFLYWVVMRLKAVALCEDTLLISNYRSQISVPLRDIESVSGSTMINPELIWLRFRHPTEFGTKIVFMPPTRFWRAFGPHPLAEELRRLVESASAGAVEGIGPDERRPDKMEAPRPGQ